MKGSNTSPPPGERSMYSLITLVSYLAVGTIVVLVGCLIVKGSGPLLHDFLELMPGHVGETPWQIWLHTVWLLLVVTLLALPLGVSAGIYFSEYAPDSFTAQKVLDAIGNLALLPPIVYGLFGWGVLSFYWGIQSGFLLVVLTSSIWLLPSVIVMTYAALQEVPVSFRRDSLALGATHWQTTYKAVLPYAWRNIAAGIFERMARVSGEVAPIIMIAASQADFGAETLRVLPYHLYRSVVESPHVGSESQLGTALLLLITALLLQFIAIVVRQIQIAPIPSVERRERGRW